MSTRAASVAESPGKPLSNSPTSLEAEPGIATSAKPAASTSSARTGADKSAPAGDGGSAVPATARPSASSTAQRSVDRCEDLSTRRGSSTWSLCRTGPVALGAHPAEPRSAAPTGRRVTEQAGAEGALFRTGPATVEPAGATASAAIGVDEMTVRAQGQHCHGRAVVGGVAGRRVPGCVRVDDLTSPSRLVLPD